jgi:hypothetical protein
MAGQRGLESWIVRAVRSRRKRCLGGRQSPHDAAQLLFGRRSGDQLDWGVISRAELFKEITGYMVYVRVN